MSEIMISQVSSAKLYQKPKEDQDAVSPGPCSICGRTTSLYKITATAEKTKISGLVVTVSAPKVVMICGACHNPYAHGDSYGRSILAGMQAIGSALPSNASE
jgi:hypothetical protein